MSAIVCGKRSLFEDLAAASPPVSKKIRCFSSSSPARFSPPPPSSLLLDHLAAIFPDMDKQVILDLRFFFFISRFVVARIGRFIAIPRSLCSSLSDIIAVAVVYDAVCW